MTETTKEDFLHVNEGLNPRMGLQIWTPQGDGEICLELELGLYK